MSNHIWKITDDIVVYYFHHYGGRELSNSTISSICDSLGMPEKSFKARIQNLTYVLTKGQQGLSNVAKQTIEVADLFEYASQYDPNFQKKLKEVVNRILK